ncbi:PDZ domain-containing protein [Actinacidiphila acididurans]|uniref:PDZ domain-containing protein n=1 Tax=Actinacidiphila acididurans TaxID=2784346 RepID=A0ABS2U3G5_9ACTN|nr:PDZ domain-containing protein [Actinacidiphila acididurans]MBM9510129.1 PDZ domain-containing protein [Actinacidiphila acididurans]
MAAAIGAALLAGTTPAAFASSPVTRTSAVRAVTPQQNVPTLDAPGPAQTVTYGADGITRRHFSRITVQAPPNTRITALDPNCVGWTCPVTIAPDGKSATADFPSGNWIWIYPFHVGLAAEGDAPLSGGTYSGTFSLDGDTQPLTVNISPGTQGAISAFLTDTPIGGSYVNFVLPGSNTAQSGLQVGDIITAVDGRPTSNTAAVNNDITGRRAGTAVPITVFRGGSTLNLQLVLD